MTELAPLFDCLNAIHPISEAFNSYLAGVVRSQDYSKGELLLREGIVCKKVWWLRSGMVRFFYKNKESEVSHCFMAENNILLAIRSLYDQAPSKQAIQALENASTWYIEYEDLLVIYEAFPEAHIIGRKIAEQYYSLLETRLHAIAQLKAKERYVFLEKDFPELLKRVQLKYLASFLDLEVHTLSRLRRQK